MENTEATFKNLSNSIPLKIFGETPEIKIINDNCFQHIQMKLRQGKKLIKITIDTNNNEIEIWMATKPRLNDMVYNRDKYNPSDDIKDVWGKIIKKGNESFHIN